MSIISDNEGFIGSIQTMLDNNGYTCSITEEWDAETNEAWVRFALANNVPHQFIPPDLYSIPQPFLDQIIEVYNTDYDGLAKQAAVREEEKAVYHQQLLQYIEDARKQSNKMDLVRKIIADREKSPQSGPTVGPIMGPGGAITWNPRKIGQINPPQQETGKRTGLETLVKLR